MVFDFQSCKLTFYRLSDASKANYEARKSEVADFNANNAFRKRGIALVPMTWFHNLYEYKYTVQVCLKIKWNVQYSI